MTCGFRDCEEPSVATSTDPIYGGKGRVCQLHAETLDRLDDLSRDQYRQLGDPRADRDRLVVWDDPS